jgi:pimeloyl-ACP methyl ester carboxylesterase
LDNTDLIVVETSLGPIHFRGRDTGKPILLLITGSFASENTADRLADRFPAMDCLRAHLPGNHCPQVAHVSIGIFAGAFTEALDRRFSGRPVVVTGLSIGGLVALAIRARMLRGILAVEPLLVSDEAWPLLNLRTQAPPGNEDFLWNILGIGPDKVERRDYRPMLGNLTTPTYVILGDEVPPVGEWPEYMPGLLGPLSRQALASHPKITVDQLTNVGHNILKYGPYALLNATKHLIQHVIGGDAAIVDLP